MINPRYLIAYLKADPDIANALGTVMGRGGELVPVVRKIREPIWNAMPQRAITVKSAGGPEPSGRNNDLVVGRQDVRCYGKNEDDAWQLHDIVYKLLRYGEPRRNMGGKIAVTIRPTAGGIDLIDPDGDWPFVWMEYTMALSEGR